MPTKNKGSSASSSDLGQNQEHEQLSWSEIYVNGLQFSFTACRILKGGFGLHGLAIVAATLFESVSSASKRVCLNMMQNPWSWMVFYGFWFSCSQHFSGTKATTDRTNALRLPQEREACVSQDVAELLTILAEWYGKFSSMGKPPK